MKFATVAEARDHFTEYITRAERSGEPVVVTRHGKPCALIQPISQRDLEEFGWNQLAADRLSHAWEGDDDALYDYL